jgi:hypothetical protein
MNFCYCGYYLYLNAADDASVSHVCKNCGYNKPLDPKTKEEALILETNFRSGSSAGGAASGINVNSYTLNDPTLPHMRGAQAPACPNSACTTQTDPGIRDVIYIKTDPTNLKFQYICTACVSQWGN